MAFERKAATETAAPTTKVATTATSKKSKEAQAVTWINFTLILQTKKGEKKVSAGIPADAVFKKLFGDNFFQTLSTLTEEQLESICSKISVDNFAINLVTPTEENEFEDLF